MNADPDEGQPTTVPEPTAPAKTPPEATVEETVDAAVEAEAIEAEAEATEPDDGEAEAPEAEIAEPAAEADATADEPEAAEPEAAEPEATSAAATEAEPEAEEPEPDLIDPEPDLIDPEPTTPSSTPASTPPAATTPLVAGRYRLVSEIGGGAMGVVWRARDEVLGRDVAVKELRPDHGMSGAQVRTSHQRARREGRIAARLQHPNAVVIYDVAEHDGRPYLIMEYVPSQSLGDILATGAVLTPTEVTSIGAQLASALTAAHERGIVHRDIKPGNVLMTSDGTVKLTDFGISRAAGDATVTATGEILGTPAYTAPEVAQGHPVAFPADVFSLGATLYAAAEGTPPFGEDTNAMATLLRVVRNEIRHPKRSGPLTDTIMWMLNPEPADRPTMKQAWQGLDQLSGKPLPVADIRASAPVTRAFEAPSPTIVVPDPAAAQRGGGRGGTVLPEQPIVHPLASLATPAAAPMSTPTAPPPSAPISAPLPTPAPAPISTPTSSSSLIAATPTSAMAAVPTPTRNTELATSKAKKSPAAPPPPTDDPSALTPASPPPNRRSRMPLAIVVCVVGTAVLIVAIVVAMNSGDKTSPNQPSGHGSTTPAQSAASHPSATSSSSQSQNQTQSQSQSQTSSQAPPAKPSSTPSSTPSSSASTPSAPAGDLATQMTTFLTNYYGLLPNNLTAAWPQMTVPYQTNVARGFNNYQAFWNSYQQVTISDVVATLPSTVVATIHYVGKDGSHTDERTSFGLVKDGTSFKIDTSHVIG